MIEIKCTKAEYKRIINALICGNELTKGKCVMGKGPLTCPAISNENSQLTCEKCLRNNIRRVEPEEIKTVKINLNEHVKFKLTQRGMNIYYHRNDELNSHLIKRGIKIHIQPKLPSVDEEGYSSMQLWEFINLYGKYMFIGADMLVDPLEIVYERKGENNVKRNAEKL